MPENASFLLIKTRKSRDAYLEDYFLEKLCARRAPPKGRVVFFLNCLALGVAVLLEVFFELVAPYLYRAAQPHARDLSAAQSPVDPALAHTKLSAQLRDRE